MREEKWIEAINKIQMDDAMKQRLYHNCMRERTKKTMKRKFFRPVAVGIGAICILIGIPAVAQIASYVEARMQEMSQEEVKSINEMVQNQAPEVNADSYSRELTKEEKEREDALFKQYTDEGKFPKGEVKLVDGEDASLADTLYYNTKNSHYNLPTRALTDEELLEMIDFYHKRDYSLQQMNKVEKPKVDMAKVKDMNLMEKAQYVIEGIYHVDTTKMQSEIECVDETEKRYDVGFTKGSQSYWVGISGEELKICTLGKSLEKELKDYRVVTKEIAENERDLVEKSKNLLKEQIGAKQAVKNIWCNYFVGDGDRAQDRKIHFMFEMEDGSACIFRYVQEDGTLYGYDYVSNFAGYQEGMARDNENKQKRGIHCKRELFKVE